jgi:K+:H+ antiporter
MHEPLSTSHAYLLVMALIFTAPYLAWRLARINYYAPLVVVQIVAGIELDLRQAWLNRRECVITAGLALVAPLLLGALVAVMLNGDPRWVGAGTARWQFVAGVGMACAVTALPVLIPVLDKLSIFRAALGHRLVRYASLDDIAIWVVLAIILMDLQQIGLQCAFVGALTAGSYAYRRLMLRLSASDRWYTGAVTDADWFDGRETAELRRGVLLLLMPVYFLVTGLRTDWGLDNASEPLAAGALLAAAVVGKLIGVRLAGRILGWPAEESSLIGWILQTKELIMIVFTGVLLDAGIISRETFTALLLMGLASTILTVPVAAPKLRRLPGGSHARP